MDEAVEAYVASWIEIAIAALHTSVLVVEAYVASWIEITILFGVHFNICVEAYVASWIEIVRLRTCIYIRQTSRLT